MSSFRENMRRCKYFNSWFRLLVIFQLYPGSIHNFLLLLVFLSYIEIGEFQQVNPLVIVAVLERVNSSDVTIDELCPKAYMDEFYREILYTYFWCRVDEKEMLRVNNLPNLITCNGFDCWESQLTEVSKIEIVRIMNVYRQKVAEGTCKKWCESNNKRVIFELRWAYDMELEAIQAASNCSKNLIILNQETYSDFSARYYGVGKVVLEKVSVSFALRTGLQREMRKILWKLISENYLYDWDEKTREFRRGQMIDIGCVYVLRRNVDFFTSLGENVRSGNVGHLTCVFFAPVEKLNPSSGDATDLKCKESIPTLNFVIRMHRIVYYPDLCKVQIDVKYRPKPSSVCFLPMPKFCASSDPINSVTWQEKLYGLGAMVEVTDKPNGEPSDIHLLHALCTEPNYIPLAQEEPENIYHYNCTLKQEVYIQADSNLCSNWYCEDSQLTDVMKLNIIRSLNRQRNIVTSGINCSELCSSPCPYCTRIEYCNMAKVRWHWFLEQKAADIVQTCPTSYVFQEEQFDDGPFRDTVVYERISLLFDLPASEGQSALGETFAKLFWKNAFQDWDDENKFRRGNALWIGCSVILRPNVNVPQMDPQWKLNQGIATHMTCVYAALNNSFTSIIGNAGRCCEVCDPAKTNPVHPCQVRLIPNVPPFPNLCTSTLFEITQSCEVNYCEGEKYTSKAWKTFYKGLTVYQHVNGSFTSVLRIEGNRVSEDQPPSNEPLSKVAMRKKFCWILALILLVVSTALFLLLSLVFKYISEEKIFQARLLAQEARKSKKHETKSSHR